MQVGSRPLKSPKKLEGGSSEVFLRFVGVFWSKSFRCVTAVALLGFGWICDARAETLIVSGAWVPVADAVGRDIPLLATIKNEANVPDALMRVRCPVANFSEKHTVDRGEGAPAMRAIGSIPIPASGSIVLKPTEYHVMLLQTRQSLAVGDRFTCTLIFQKAGAIETEVEVRQFP